MSSQSLLEIVRSQLGIQEIPKGSNDGPDVRKYLSSVNINQPAYWCMAFGYWSVDEYCKRQGIKNPLFKTASVMTQWKMRPLLRVEEPQPEDMFIIDLGKGSGHTGFVEEVKGNRIYTIEGNSNEDGSNNGYEVCRKPGGRLITNITGFIRPFLKK